METNLAQLNEIACPRKNLKAIWLCMENREVTMKTCNIVFEILVDDYRSSDSGEYTNHPVWLGYCPEIEIETKFVEFRQRLDEMQWQFVTTNLRSPEGDPKQLLYFAIAPILSVQTPNYFT
jgi:hypothetical protein